MIIRIIFLRETQILFYQRKNFLNIIYFYLYSILRFAMKTVDAEVFFITNLKDRSVPAQYCIFQGQLWKRFTTHSLYALLALTLFPLHNYCIYLPYFTFSSCFISYYVRQPIAGARHRPQLPVCLFVNIHVHYPIDVIPPAFSTEQQNPV